MQHDEYRSVGVAAPAFDRLEAGLRIPDELRAATDQYRGEMDVVSDAVPRLTGHEATSLEAFLKSHPESYQHLLA